MESERTERLSTVLSELDNRGILLITLNRPEKSNAFDSNTIALLTTTLETYYHNAEVKCLVLRANGKHFSAGADLKWMLAMSAANYDENLSDASALAQLLYKLDTFPVPTIALVQGNAYGGALGLICCCDIAIGLTNSQYCLSETKLGLVPATISPYVVRAMGVRQARFYMLTATPFNGEQARALGVLHQICADHLELQTQSQQLIESVLSNSPQAIRRSKALCFDCDESKIDNALIDLTSQAIALARASKDGKEGVSAFLEKRAPIWVTRSKD
ncbi:enoyl-CoA hydratase-related protein [Vibrio sonorensis]|uniref:enoyl-CoA hydratase-related protein n=1 Tax=Vibrio sonorensis TaxID=1004316 RepID=UPI0008DA0A5A|nr:enoyl-CoA hydratase-related protein [Vibrio sonorensis]